MDNKILLFSTCSSQTDTAFRLAKLKGLDLNTFPVFTKNNTPKHMITQIKQHGALLAKGRLLGIQFAELFTDDLYMSMGRNGVKWADSIREDLKAKGYTLYMENPTNQIFVVMDNAKLEQLKENVVYDFWEKYDEAHTVIRIATSWGTTKEDVEALKKIL